MEIPYARPIECTCDLIAIDYTNPGIYIICSRGLESSECLNCSVLVNEAKLYLVRMRGGYESHLIQIPNTTLTKVDHLLMS